MSKVGRFLQHARPVLTGTFIVATATILLCACLTTDQPIESDPKDPRAQSVIDKVRALDLLPRTLGPAQTTSSNPASRSRPFVSYGDNVAAVNSPQAAESTPSGDGFDLNFENAPVTTVAKVVLGDILGVGYTIDPRVQGTVTLASGRPVPKSDMLFVLENALRMSSVSLLRDRVGYRIVPAADAVGVNRLDNIGSTEAGQGITVIPLRYVSSQTILKLLDGFGVKAGSLRADASRNILIAQGSGAERGAALETVLSFDTDWMRGQSVGVFPVRNSAPETLIAEIEKIMDSGDGGLGQNMVRFQPIGRLNAILVVSQKPAYLKTAANWISRLDESDTAGTNLKVYRLRYGNARQISGLLNDILVGRTASSLDSAAGQLAPDTGMGVSSSSAGTLASLGVPPAPGAGGAAVPSAALAQRGGVAASSGGGDLRGGRDAAPGSGFGASSGSSGRAAGSAGPGALPNVRITADSNNNSILVYANQETHIIVGQTIRQIDRPQLQVAIDATIAEVTLNDNLNYGVQFFLRSQDVGLKPDKGSAINTLASAAAGAAINRVLPGFNFLVGSEANPRVILDALHGITNVKVLSNPSLVVLDNQAATLQVGDQIPVSTGSANVLTANNTIVNTIDYRNTGIILRVLPRVNTNGNVILDIEQEISNVAAGSAGTLTPTVSQRRVKSSISVISGQTVLLAGLISETENRQRQGIPLLDQIPVVGDAFSHQGNVKSRTELIIFIRPVVVRDSFDASVVAEELRSKLNGRLVGTTLPVPVLNAPSRRQ